MQRHTATFVNRKVYEECLLRSASCCILKSKILVKETPELKYVWCYYVILHWFA